MTGVVVNPSHAHGFSSFEKTVGGEWRAWCLCGACWSDRSKPAASRALHKHLSERAREFRKLRAELRKQMAIEQYSAPSESGAKDVMEVPRWR